MRFYCVSDTYESYYRPTLAEAHEVGKSLGNRDDVTISLVEIGNDRETLLRLLNSAGGYASPTLRSWELTPRGGLIETTPKD